MSKDAVYVAWGQPSRTKVDNTPQGIRECWTYDRTYYGDGGGDLDAHFPNYRYADMVEAEHRLVVDGLHVDHLRLVMGTSMGGMPT